MNKIAWEIWIIGLLCLVAGCSPITVEEHTMSSLTLSPAMTALPETTPAPGLSPDELVTLNSLKRVDKYPLYTMTYHGAYHQDVYTFSSLKPRSDLATPQPAWGCSLFAAFGDGKDMFYGRNFDWRYSPALLLFTDPPEGYRRYPWWILAI
jgi:hypothetical protein